MKANKKITPNRYKPAPKPPRAKRSLKVTVPDQWTRWIGGISLTIALTALAIYAHDFILQSGYFTLKEVHIQGNRMTTKQEIIDTLGLEPGTSLLSVNTGLLEKKIQSMPWVASVTLDRNLPDKLNILISEESALAVAGIEPVAGILINTHGKPFKEYDVKTDAALGLPTIQGLTLEKNGTGYRFKGRAFQAALDILQMGLSYDIQTITCHAHMGITIEVPDHYNVLLDPEQPSVRLKLGFDRFEEKLARAGRIASYMETHIPQKRIYSMDLYDMENIFVKTTDNETLHNNLEKGV